MPLSPALHSSEWNVCVSVGNKWTKGKVIITLMVHTGSVCI